jgi:hypothetical protein
VPQRVASAAAELKSAQRRVLLALESQRGTSLTRGEYERLTGVARSQAAYDLSELVSAGLLIRVGGGRSTRYVLAHEPASQRQWTPDRIRRELDMFCANRSAWPTAREFKTAGRGDLYVAASRYGGVAHWASELGLERIDRSRIAATARAPLRIRLAWGFAGALAAGALAAAALAAVAVTHPFGSSGKTRPQAFVGLQSPLLIVHEPVRRQRPAARHTRPQTGKQTTRQTPKPNSHTQSTPTQQMSLVSEPLQTAQATSRTVAATASPSAGPTPLRAPTGGSAPSALRAP